MQDGQREGFMDQAWKGQISYLLTFHRLWKSVMWLLGDHVITEKLERRKKK